MLAEQVPGLLRYARTLTRDPERAADLVQDTVLRALQHADSFRGEAAPATWLHRILHNLAVDQARRSREVAVEDLASLAEAAWRDEAYTVDAAAVVQRSHDRAELRDALLRLPLIYRSAVVLHDAEGLTAVEIAAVHGIGLPAAKQRLRRGRMMLVTVLAEGAGRNRVEGVPMRCWEARRQVSDYLDGELPARTRLLLERHLEGCPTCPPLYAALVGSRAGVHALRDPDEVVPEALAERITRLLAERPHG